MANHRGTPYGSPTEPEGSAAPKDEQRWTATDSVDDPLSLSELNDSQPVLTPPCDDIRRGYHGRPRGEPLGQAAWEPN